MNYDIKRKLIDSAVKVRTAAYAPYSNFLVGAAILSDDGEIYTGANFENVSFGAGVCAERVALGAALSQGKRKFSTICVSGQAADITPCGICRQSLSEFGDIDVICTNRDGSDAREYKLSDLLPYAFDKI